MEGTEDTVCIEWKKRPGKILVENLKKKKETILGILESDMSILKLTLEKYGC